MKIKCQHCTHDEMEHIVLEQGTHIHDCPKCPNVSLRYKTPIHAEMFNRYLNGDMSVVVHRFASEDVLDLLVEEPMELEDTEPIISMDYDRAASNEFAKYFDTL